MGVALLTVRIGNGQVREREPRVRALVHATPADGWMARLTMTDDAHDGLPQTRHCLKIGGVGMRDRTTHANGDEQREGETTANGNVAAPSPDTQEGAIHGCNTLL